VDWLVASYNDGSFQSLGGRRLSGNPPSRLLFR
jgi:hypothetical protein